MAHILTAAAEDGTFLAGPIMIIIITSRSSGSNSTAKERGGISAVVSLMRLLNIPALFIRHFGIQIRRRCTRQKTGQV